MKFLILVKACEATEAGVPPSQKDLEGMGAFNEELVKAGVMQAAEGLQPSSKAARVRVTKAGASVVDGPFAETKELVAGFWIWELPSLAEAVAWARRCPVCHDLDSEMNLEIRPIFGHEDPAHPRQRAAAAKKTKGTKR